MADGTKIEWTDATWTPIRARHKGTGKLGWHCEHASPGCMNCYSEDLNEKRFGTGLPFKPGHRDDVEHFLDETMLTQPLRWRRPRMVFVCSMTDLFGDWVSDEWIDRVFAVMALAPQHTFQVLTKRPERMRQYLARDWAARARAEVSNLTLPTLSQQASEAWDRLNRYGTAHFGAPLPLENAWLGVSAEDQRRADERIPLLVDTPAAVRWVSAEPLLGPIDFTFFRQPNMGGGPWWFDALNRNRAGWFADEAATIPTDDPHDHDGYVPRLDWIVVGGESGLGARPMHPAWVRSIRDQCVAADVPFLFKQWGAWAHSEQAPAPVPGPSFFNTDGRPTGDGWHFWTDGDQGTDASIRVGKKRAGRSLDGVTHDAFPKAA